MDTVDAFTTNNWLQMDSHVIWQDRDHHKHHEYLGQHLFDGNLSQYKWLIFPTGVFPTPPSLTFNPN